MPTVSSSAIPDPSHEAPLQAIGESSSRPNGIRFGLFGGAQAPRENSDPAGGFLDYVDMCVEAEALGFASTFLVEHHFSGTGQVSASLDLLAWVAARTTTMRLGTAVIVLPWHDPVMLAERAATLDLMSGGRLEFGVGKGYRHTEFSGFSTPYEEAEPRFHEALGVIIKAWTSDVRFSHHGRFWHYEDIVVDPPALQRPHPPVWIAAGKPDSIRSVAARGRNLLLDQFASTSTIGDRIALFRAECEARGRLFDPMDVAVARNLYVARDTADTQTALLRLAQSHKRMLALSQHPDGRNQSHITAYADTPGLTEASALYGTADQIATELEALGAVGVQQILLHSGQPQRQTLRRFSTEIMRRSRDAIGHPWRTVRAFPYALVKDNCVGVRG
jgi:alkanesulfonate monooxygenase SsuD/methylene tetrahydromethanopterin reductase-like flavin-dependent oxidoreductase (luciferase family)